ncbi:MAG: haloacid dehalogenase-like hydrolase [Bacteroidales bacterium]|nr:haloacid dehalogenase-like hydrolase [Bacteroidales bacterium]
MKRFYLLPILLLFFSCAQVLDRGQWEEEPYHALCELLRDQSLKGGYAVFDCDKTTILNDVSHTLMVYQIENLEFADAVSENFLHGLPRTDFTLEGLGMTADEMGRRLASQYCHLKDRLSEGVSLEEIHKDDEYLDFRAGFLSFHEAVGDNYGYGDFCLWEPMLFSGLPVEVGEQSLRYWLSQGRVWEEEWVSPDGRFRATVEKGLVITPEIKNLYSALRHSGITPYICSASPEWLVEALVCNPENGLCLSPDNVFGLRFKNGEYDPEYPQSYKEGKVACIDSLIAPLHAGIQPVLVAGDSSGDVPMLTAYPSMRVGLIINYEKGGEIEQLLQKNDSRYVSQSACRLINM